MEHNLELLAKHRRPLLAAAIALAVVVAYIDFTFTAEVDICHLYFASIAGVAWFCSRRTSVIYALGTGVLSVLPHYVHGMPSSTTMTMYAVIVTASYVSAALVVNQFAATLHQMGELARTDALTGVPNARDFQTTLGAEFRRSKRYHRSLTVAYIDVDDFKEVNDSRGHLVGDEVLASIANLISERIRKQDVLGRLGGDEFGLLLPETDPDEARPMLERIAQDVGALAAAEGWPVTISVGATGLGSTRHAGDTEQDLLRYADALMYQVKENGKGHAIVEWYAAPGISAA